MTEEQDKRKTTVVGGDAGYAEQHINDHSTKDDHSYRHQDNHSSQVSTVDNHSVTKVRSDDHSSHDVHMTDKSKHERTGDDIGPNAWKKTVQGDELGNGAQKSTVMGDTIAGQHITISKDNKHGNYCMAFIAFMAIVGLVSVVYLTFIMDRPRHQVAVSTQQIPSPPVKLLEPAPVVPEKPNIPGSAQESQDVQKKMVASLSKPEAFSLETKDENIKTTPSSQPAPGKVASHEAGQENSREVTLKDIILQQPDKKTATIAEKKNFLTPESSRPVTTKESPMVVAKKTVPLPVKKAVFSGRKKPAPSLPKKKPMEPPEKISPVITPKKSSFQISYATREKGTGYIRQIENGSVLRSGDDYKLIFMPESKGYVYIFQADSAGQFYQLFPMKDRRGKMAGNVNPVQPGRRYTLPGDDRSFRLDNQTGREQIYFIASPIKDQALENLYEDIVRARKTGNRNREKYAQGQLKDRLRTRGIAQIVEDRTWQVSWEGSRHVFDIVSQRLDQLSDDCVHVMEFEHR